MASHIYDMSSESPTQFNEVYIDEFDALYISLDAPEIPKKYPAKQHARKVAQNLGVTSGLIYLLGTPGILSEDSDEEIPFKQRRYFFYLSGADFSDCSLTYDIESDALHLYIPPPNPAEVIWLGPTPSVKECEDKYDVDYVGYTFEVPRYVRRWRLRNPSSKLYVLHPDHFPAGLSASSDGVDAASLQPAMDDARVIKTEYEIGLIRKANDVSSRAHRRVLSLFGNVTNETHIEAIFNGSCVFQGAKKQAYGIIAGSGANASTLHYVANNQDIAGRQLVCLDAGCEWDCYASDITRTFPITGTFSKEAKEIYTIVEEMQGRCIERIKPGTVFLDLHRLAMEIGVRGLMRLGILHNGTYEEIAEAGTGRAFFPHGLGHHLGLETHDVNGARRLLASSIPTLHELRLQSRRRLRPLPAAAPPPYDGHRELEANMVVTVEPGLYFSRYALEEVYRLDPVHAQFIDFGVVERYYKVGGVRIEDDILVTETGYENLTTAPKGEEACEIVRRSLGRGRGGGL